MPGGPVQGDSSTIQQLFAGGRFRLDYYQREYSWERDDVRTLLDDLARRFLMSWNVTHGRTEVRNYHPYFLGPYVYFEDDGFTYLVDGQQRFTTLHLLLIYVHHLLLEQGEEDDAQQLTNLIVRQEFGQRAFTMDVEGREGFLDAFLGWINYELPSKVTPSVHTLASRASDLVEDFPQQLRDEALPYFVDWLRHQVCLVGIRALSREHGREIFETMNNRGARLTPIDLLKGHLIDGAGKDRTELNVNWRSMLTDLSEVRYSAPSEFIKNLITAKYARSCEGADGFNGEDVRLIESEVQEWVRTHAKEVGLRTADDYYRFLRDQVFVLGKTYKKLIYASSRWDVEYQAIYYNAVNGITSQYIPILAALRPSDTDSEVKTKTQLISNYLDLLYVRKFINNKAAHSADLVSEVRQLALELRMHPNVDDVRGLLSKKVAELDDDFSALTQEKFGLRPDNRAQVRYLLARLTSFVEVNSGNPNDIEAYLDRNDPYHIEHIWANKFERHQHHTQTHSAFNNRRNQLGGLLLLPGSDNSSYNADHYGSKLENYFRNNLLASSLNPKAYQNYPGFSKFRKKYDLEKLFAPYVSFEPKSFDERQRLYEKLCELVWSPEELGFEIPKQDSRERRVKTRTRANYGVEVEDLLSEGYLTQGERLLGRHKGIDYRAWIEQKGRIRLESGEVFKAPSRAAMFVLDRGSWNGWTFWQVDRKGKLVLLKNIRDQALNSGDLES